MIQEIKHPEVTHLRELIQSHRDQLQGHTFVSHEEAFKFLEHLKVRLSWLLGNKPDHTTQQRRRRRGRDAKSPGKHSSPPGQ